MEEWEQDIWEIGEYSIMLINNELISHLLDIDDIAEKELICL